MTNLSTIESLHKCWERITGQTINMRATERIWYEFSQMEFTEDDLTCVLNDLMRFNRGSNGAKFRINLQKICGCAETFASLLGEARAKQRNKIKATTPKEQVLKEFRRSPEQQSAGSTRSVSEVFRALTTTPENKLK